MTAAILPKTPSADSERVRDDWLKKLAMLFDSVEGWVQAAGWSTRRITKRMQDSDIGVYEAPALLMQEGAVRTLLEPITRRAVGGDAVVDLYVMPAYDDIASLALRGDQWRIYYSFPEGPKSRDAVEAEPVALSQDGFLHVLDEMKKHVVLPG